MWSAGDIKKAHDEAPPGDTQFEIGDRIVNGRGWTGTVKELLNKDAKLILKIEFDRHLGFPKGMALETDPVLDKVRRNPTGTQQQINVSLSSEKNIASYRSWDKLASNEKDLVAFMLLVLKEFAYGYDESGAMRGRVPLGSAKDRFYANSLYNYIYKFFLLRKKSDDKIHEVLEAIGSDDLLKPITQILDLQMGTTTLREIIRAFRNKIVTHRLLNLTEFEETVLKDFDFRESSNAGKLSDAIGLLFYETRNLYVEVAKRYPEASDHQLPE